MVITIAPPTAVQKPSTWKPRSNCSASQPVSSSMQALITSRNSPSVTMMNGIDRICRIGFTNDEMTPRISDTSSQSSHLSSNSARNGWDAPSNQMPSKIQAATASATA